MELQLWREMLTPYELAVDELVLKFRHIIREYRNVGRYSPIEQVDGRVKSISSILDKMQRKKINVNDVEKELEDHREPFRYGDQEPQRLYFTFQRQWISKLSCDHLL